MRIVSGQLKGIRFSPPKSFSARPTTDFAKENLFNVLGNRIDFEDQKVLDLFGGTGSISYEFASRGCQHITCIEKNFKHYKFISDTVKQLKLDTQIRPFKYCSFKYLEKCDETFDIIFADPPFDLKTLDNLPDLVFSRPILSENGFFILEHSDKKSFSNHPHFFEVRKYGKVHFSLFK